ncbi:MAG TPA: 1-acyl-sn-glycerol-3-phosphate acyltransferase [Pseudonocardiaceae bacterium]|nr:1-acyl-sn-glycerol-3-phosphate acyltransferase [Pseudonocardiaceae bacterium]
MSGLRRAVTVPLVVAVELALLSCSPLLLAAAMLVGLALRSTRPVRTVALVCAYAAIELLALRRLLSTVDDVNEFVRDMLGIIYQALRRILDVRVVLEHGSATTAQVSGRALVVLSRHCGPGDTLFVAWLLAVHYRLRLRIVLKTLLRAEPALDLLGDKLPLCFIGARGKRSRDRIHATAADLTGGDALLLFPEGGNFSRPRWAAAVLKLAATGKYLASLRARRRTHTLPPRTGGAHAALTGAPAADVLLLAHTGFTDDGRDRPWWRLPVQRDLVVRTSLVPAAEVPREADALAGWLDSAWTRVDSWVAGHAQDAD